MTEEYLHLIWKTKRLSNWNFIASNQSIVEVKHVGEYNSNLSGPDFFNAKVKIDGILFSGNVEIHIKSSDWYKHNHNNDDAYKSVILHVVLINDKPVYIDNQELTTIELNDFIDFNHYSKTENFLKAQSSNEIICSNLIHSIPEPVFWNQIENSFYTRLFRKSSFYSEMAMVNQNDISRLWLLGLIKAFGFKTNEIPFLQLGLMIPINKMITCVDPNWKALLLGLSGLLPYYKTDIQQLQELNNWCEYYFKLWDLTPMDAHIWKFKGCRPKGFPTIRLVQLAVVLSNVNVNIEWWEFKVTEIIDFFKKLFEINPKVVGRTNKDISISISEFIEISENGKDTILMNSITAFLIWFGTHFNNEEMLQKAFDIAVILKPDDNNVIKKFNKIGFNPKSSMESQGILELFNELCSRKKCFSCRVGIQILNQ